MHLFEEKKMVKNCNIIVYAKVKIEFKKKMFFIFTAPGVLIYYLRGIEYSVFFFHSFRSRITL